MKLITLTKLGTNAYEELTIRAARPTAILVNVDQISMIEPLLEEREDTANTEVRIDGESFFCQETVEMILDRIIKAPTDE